MVPVSQGMIAAAFLLLHWRGATLAMAEPEPVLGAGLDRALRMGAGGASGIGAISFCLLARRSTPCMARLLLASQGCRDAHWRGAVLPAAACCAALGGRSRGGRAGGHITTGGVLREGSSVANATDDRIRDIQSSGATVE